MELVQESYLRLLRVREGEEIRSAKALLFAGVRCPFLTGLLGVRNARRGSQNLD